VSSLDSEVSPSLPAEAITAGPGLTDRVEGIGPWRLAVRRLRRNRVALTALAVFVFMVLISTVGATVYSHWIGKDDSTQNVTGKVERGGKKVDVVTPDGTPVGPALSKDYLLGGDQLGRDVAVRLLYGGRISLFVGFMSAFITVFFAVSLGLLAGFYRGSGDRLISSFFDIVWSFPVILLAIALGTALAVSGLNIGPIHIDNGSIWIPTVIIGFVYIPYLGRPVRGQVLALREKEFVEAAVAQGMRPLRIMFSEILPNITSTIMVFGTLIIANNILTEAALSYLGAGVQPPTPSWGNLISDGTPLIATAPSLSLVPGVAIVVCVLSLNLFGDGLRDALDPRAKVRLR
jgi:peptide/nickel transport system permease protein